MKIQDRTKIYHYLLIDLFYLINTILAGSLYFYERLTADKMFGVFIGFTVLLVFIASLIFSLSPESFSFIPLIRSYIIVAIISIVYIVVLFIKNPWYGAIMLLCFIVEAALIPVIEYRWRIANKIKAHFKKKQNDK